MSSPDGIVERQGLKIKHVQVAGGAFAEQIATIPIEQPAGARPDIGDSGVQTFIKANGKAVKCAPGATTVLKTTGNGAKGNVITKLLFLVSDNSTGTVALTDGDGTAYIDGTPNPWNATVIRPANATYYTMELDQESFNGPWSITCGAGVTVVAQGFFS